ncbi:MAG: phosphoadenylyl-sulfate reductase [Chloroflexota bacterium]
MLENLKIINAEMETASPEEILTWAEETFGDQLVVSSSFQTQSVPLLHKISLAAPKLPVLFVDTGFHFPETLKFRDQLVDLFNLNLVVVQPVIVGKAFEQKFGPLYEHNPDVCCFHNKIIPLELTLKKFDAWVTGIRRDQTAARGNVPVVGRHPGLEMIKIMPMARWSSAEIDCYIDDHALPRHPLWERGFRSVGCQPCTVAVEPNQFDRDGRWPQRGKQECGVHSV